MIVEKMLSTNKEKRRSDKKNKGFTLVESFDKSMDITVLSAKRILESNEELIADNLKKSLDYSSDNYLGYWTDTNGNLLSDYKTSYPAFVYDENSSLYQYVQNYESYFKNVLGKKSVSATLIKEEQLVELGCKDFDVDHVATCPNSLKFFENLLISYTGTVPLHHNGNIISVFGNAIEEGNILGEEMTFEDFPNIVGIRPVITISKSEL